MIYVAAYLALVFTTTGLPLAHWMYPPWRKR